MTSGQTKSLVARLNDRAVRGWIYQALVVGGVVLIGWYLIATALENLERQGIATGLDYLGLESGFDIADTPIDYSAADSYGRALFVGFLNTLKVSFIGIVLATVIGTIAGIARLSTNWLVARLATVYVEGLRNVPLLLQLFLWYGVILNALPGWRESLTPIDGIFLNNRGLFFPVPVAHPVYVWMLLAFAAGITIAWGLKRWADRRQARTGKRPLTFWYTLFAIVGLPLAVYVVGGMPVALDVPSPSRFNLVGGVQLPPEFTALLLGLTIYTSAFIAEVVRSGIQAVPKGQWEAARSVGLRSNQIMRLVVLPQALRVIIPPMTNQYLNLTKNSSLAIGIGYPDLVYVTETTLNQTGQAIEAIAIMMVIYLLISVSTSVFMNWYNKRKALVEG